MSNFSSVLNNIKGYARNNGDDAYIRVSIAQALKQLRSVRTHFSEGSFQFYTESGKSEYTYGYPGFPDDFLGFDTIYASSAQVGGIAVIQPTSITTKTNLAEGADDTETLSWLTEDRPYDVTPRTDHSWIPSGSGSVVWEVKFATPTAAIPDGTGRNTIYFNAKKVGSPASVVVSVIDKYGTDYTVYSQSAFQNELSTTNDVYELVFDARALNENPPTDLNFKIEYTGSTTDYVELNSVEWITGYSSAEAGANKIELVDQSTMRGYLSSRNSSNSGCPQYGSWHHDILFLDPTPSDVYEIYGDYQKDATRDSVTGEEITATARGNETNAWFQRGQGMVEALALSIYAAQRLNDQNLAQYALGLYNSQIKSLKLEAAVKSFKERQVRMYI